jgi:phosphoglycerate dehydrogenase-like enzyme
MTDRPDVLLLHQASHEEDAIRTAFAEQFDQEPSLRVASDPEESRSMLSDATVVLTFELTEEQLDAAGELGWVQAMNAGVDSYLVDALAERDIALTNATGVHREQMGQQVLGYLLVFERRIHEGMRQQRAGEWEFYQGGELGDDTLGVVGLGAVGSRVAELAETMGMDVVATKRDPSTATIDDCYQPDRLDGVLNVADYLVVTCGLTDETEGLIGRNELSRLDEDAVVVNVARGPVIDQSALVEALEDGDIRGAALDVSDPEPMPADSPLRLMDNVVMTPHMAGSSPYYFDRAVELFADNYRAYCAGEQLENRVV